jgi:hypothetical protein
MALTSLWNSGMASESFCGTAMPCDSMKPVQAKLGVSASASAGVTGL